MDESWFGGSQENAYAPMHSTNCKVWWRSYTGLGMFFILYATAYNDILDNTLLRTLWQQFGEGPFFFQHDNAPVPKARAIQKWYVEIGVE